MYIFYSLCTGHPIQWVPSDLSPEVKWLEDKADKSRAASSVEVNTSCMTCTGKAVLFLMYFVSELHSRICRTFVFQIVIRVLSAFCFVC